MTRPLAWAGFSALAALLLSISFLPSAASVPLAVLLLVSAALVLTVCVVCRCRLPAVFAVMLSAGIALLCLQDRQQCFLRLEQLADEQPHTITGVVYETGDGLYEGVISAVIRVETLDGEECDPFRVACSNLESCEIGDEIRLTVRFEKHKKAYRVSRFADNIALGAQQEYAGGEEVAGQGRGLLLSMAKLRMDLGRSFMVLGRRVGGTAAAMIVGDRSRMDSSVENAFRAAGISHILVVSGLHLALWSALLEKVLHRFVRRRVPRLLLSMLGLFAYMLLTGMTASVVRAGVLLQMAYAAALFDRTADTLNSLGISLIILLLVNPYAACDMGLLLSFAATLGVLCFAALDRRHWHLSTCKYFAGALQALGTSAFAALFTLPVLAWRGTLVSFGALAANVLCVWLITPVMIVGFIFLVTHLLLGTSRMLLTGRLLYVLLRILEEIAALVNRIFVYRIGVTGWSAVVILCGAMICAFVFYRSRFRIFCLPMGAAVLALLVCVSLGLNTGTVRLAMVGGGINPAIVISRDRECAVLYRGESGNIAAVREYMLLNNLKEPEYVADLSQNDYTWMLKQEFGRVDVTMGEDIRHTVKEHCLNGVELLFVRQKTGNLCYIEVGVGVCSGTVDCSSYPKCSFFLSGRSRPEGLKTACVIRAAHLPEWLKARTDLLCYSGEEPVLWLRPGKSFRILNAEKEER